MSCLNIPSIPCEGNLEQNLFGTPQTNVNQEPPKLPSWNLRLTHIYEVGLT